MLRRVIIIQARMASQRLPGKVLQAIGPRSLLDLQLARLRRCRNADEICIATSKLACDLPIVEWARIAGVCCWRGSADDVLDRYLGAARFTRAEVIVRVTADCPLLDPDVTDRVIAELADQASECDYASNVLERTFPRGLDVEVFHFDTLLRMARLAQSAAEREHVTLVARGARAEAFLRRSIVDVENHSDLRWTVDVQADLEMLRQLQAEIDLASPLAGYRQLLEHVRARPELAKINGAVGTWDPLAISSNATLGNLVPGSVLS